MNAPRMMIVVFLVLCFSVHYGVCGGTLELDLEGTLGNGPDSLAATVSDYVVVDVWAVGTELPITGITLVVCNAAGNLEYQGATYETPASWIESPPETSVPSCVRLNSIDFGAEPIGSVPALLATIEYHVAVDNVIGDLVLDLAMSGFVTSQFQTFSFESTIGATISTKPSTSIEGSTWGEVKGLFR